MKAKIPGFLLALACLTSVPATAQVNYAVSGGVAYVTQSPNASGNIVIASTYNGYPVTRIADRAFYGCARLTDVTIPDSVAGIGYEAFRACTSLTNVTLGNSVTRIEERTFESCSNLTSILIPASVTTIGDWAFRSCANLASVTIPNSVTRIEDGAFYGCAGLTDVTIPASVTFLWQGAFRACTSLTNFSVDSANLDYSSHDGVLFSKEQTTLIAFPPGRGGNYVIPNSVAVIDSYAFVLCAGLTNVTIPNGVRDIGPYAFGGCTGLTSMTIPASVLTIWHGESLSHNSLTNITFLGDPPVMWEGTAFQNVGPGATIYYYYGTTGWQSSYAGLPTVMLGAPASQFGAGTAGVKPGGFGFTIAAVVNQTIVVEASTNLLTWQPLWTNTLSALSTNFVDPQWLNHPRRFYRTRSN